jgi:hypothetical protein
VLWAREVGAYGAFEVGDGSARRGTALAGRRGDSCHGVQEVNWEGIGSKKEKGEGEKGRRAGRRRVAYKAFGVDRADGVQRMVYRTRLGTTLPVDFTGMGCRVSALPCKRKEGRV